MNTSHNLPHCTQMLIVLYCSEPCIIQERGSRRAILVLMQQVGVKLAGTAKKEKNNKTARSCNKEVKAALLYFYGCFKHQPFKKLNPKESVCEVETKASDGMKIHKNPYYLHLYGGCYLTSST